jgi:predicted dehydrogenase
MDSTQQVYRVAIVGCGRKAATLDDEERCRINYSIPPDAHAAAYLKVDRIRLAAAADPNEAKRRLMQDRYGVPATYADYREMLERERPDLVSVTTRAPLHAEVTVAAAHAGARGILCEKAMASSLAEADAMIEACGRQGTRLAVNHTRRWHPTYEAAAQAVSSGAIGELRCVVGICPGPLIHNGTHLFDLMRLLAGEVAWISGEVRGRTGHDDPGRAMLRFESGAAGFVDLDSGLGLGLELQGTRGRLFIDPAQEGWTLWEYRSPSPAREGKVWYEGNPCKVRRIRHVESSGGRGTLVAAIEELISCIEGGHEGRSSGYDGRAALELALAVYHSHAAGGARVTLPLKDRTLAVESR